MLSPWSIHGLHKGGVKFPPGASTTRGLPPNVTMVLLEVGVLAAFAALTSAQTARLGPSAFTAPGAFPTSVYKQYFNNPTQTSEQVQPIITDPVTVSDRLPMC